MIRRTLITMVLAGFGLLCATALFAGKYQTLCFEAEDGQNISGKAWLVKARKDDANNKISGKKVLALPQYAPGEKPPKDEVTYKVKIEQTGIYYLWARTYWKNGCGNSFYIKVEGYNSGNWIIGGDGTYNIMHWVCLADGGKNSGDPRPLMLKKGVVTITVGAKESATEIDQFVLTTDPGYTPANIVKTTPAILVVDEKKSAK